MKETICAKLFSPTENNINKELSKHYSMGWEFFRAESIDTNILLLFFQRESGEMVK